jgi:hypothetical protein
MNVSFNLELKFTNLLQTPLFKIFKNKKAPAVDHKENQQSGAHRPIRTPIMSV